MTTATAMLTPKHFYPMTGCIEPSVIVPIASGFDEESVVLCVSRLRERAIRVWLVSPRERTVRSQRGLIVAVDKRIREIGRCNRGTQILLTGGTYSLQSVLNSAETLSLLSELSVYGGTVLTTADGTAALNESGLRQTFYQLSWLNQSGESLSDFLNQVGTG